MPTTNRKCSRQSHPSFQAHSHIRRQIAGGAILWLFLKRSGVLDTIDPSGRPQPAGPTRHTTGVLDAPLLAAHGELVPVSARRGASLAHRLRIPVRVIIGWTRKGSVIPAGRARKTSAAFWALLKVSLLAIKVCIFSIDYPERGDFHWRVIATGAVILRY